MGIKIGNTDISKIIIGHSGGTPVTNYRYIKWSISNNRANNPSSTSVQVAEFKLYDGANELSRPAGTTCTCNQSYISGEGPDKLIDGNVNTKFNTGDRFTVPCELTIDVGSGNEIDFSVYNKYRWYTANDANGRDPITWTLSLSNDGNNWETVDTVTNATITTSRYTLAGTWDITIPTPPNYKQIRKVYLGSTQVRPAASPGWQPGVNTLAYYNISNDDDNSYIYDLSGNGVDQAWQGTASYSTDATYGRVADISSNNYGQASSIVNFGSELTFIALIKTSSTNSQTIIAECASSSTRPIGLILNRDNQGTLMFVGGAGASDPKSVGDTNTYPAPTNTWMMIAGTRSSDGTGKIYVNGVLKGTQSGINNPAYSAGENLRIGVWRSGDKMALNGQFKLFIGENRCWTDQEIADLATEYGFTVS